MPGKKPFWLQGFIWSHIVRLLLEQGERKVVASNASGSTRNLEDVLDQVEIVRTDIANFSNVLRLVQTHRPKTIYHIGAMLAPSSDMDPEAGVRTNALGPYHILEAARFNWPPSPLWRPTGPAKFVLSCLPGDHLATKRGTLRG